MSFWNASSLSMSESVLRLLVDRLVDVYVAQMVAFNLYAAFCVFFQAEDGRRDLVRSRGRGDVYK